MSVSETYLEAIEQLEEFFGADMWYSKNAEWKTEEDMLRYLKGHFNILRKQIKRIEKRNFHSPKGGSVGRRLTSRSP